MAIIYSYPRIDEVQGSDLILVADASKQNKTKSASINQVLALLEGLSGSDNYIPRFDVEGDVTTLVNSVMLQNEDNSVSVAGNLKMGLNGIFIGGTSEDNKIDDYEEGTFTPNLTTSGTEPGITTKQGRYTKIGDTVFVEIRIRDFVSENESNSVTSCTNLPFTVLDTPDTSYVTGSAFGSRFTNDSTYAGRQYVSALDNTTTLTFRNGELLGISFDVDEDAEIAVSIIYKTS